MAYYIGPILTAASVALAFKIVSFIIGVLWGSNSNRSVQDLIIASLLIDTCVTVLAAVVSVIFCLTIWS